jgi:hypothetical protein
MCQLTIWTMPQSPATGSEVYALTVLCVAIPRSLFPCGLCRVGSCSLLCVLPAVLFVVFCQHPVELTLCPFRLFSKFVCRDFLFFSFFRFSLFVCHLYSSYLSPGPAFPIACSVQSRLVR